ncbi:MAG: SDR family NAD(P)-dependent oxidoreductase [Pseudomonadales bacterium]|nr:SDR family NAD(P)-dependent oxidoreductase [Pseudomonadales bacterium]
MQNYKTLVITGGSSGIGLACVKAALQAGHCVIATARKVEDLENLKMLGAIAVKLELNDEESVMQAANHILRHSGGKIDALFNNAGYGLQVAMEDSSWQDLQRQLNSNVIGPVILTNHLLPALSAGSQIIFNSSILGLVTLPFRGPYCMSKYAIEAAADAYRLELESLNIDVHVIQPGPIEANFRQTAALKIQEVLARKAPRLCYHEHLSRLEAKGPSAGSLPAEVCAEVFLAIINRNKTQNRYLVTHTAKLAALLKRLLGSHFHHIAKTKPQAKARL